MQAIQRELNILIVEDNPADLYYLQEILKGTKLPIGKIYSADRICDAKELLRTCSIQLVLLDLCLPDSFGIETFLGLKDLSVETPVIILTGTTDISLGREAIKEGAQDYLVKGEYDENLLARSIQYSFERNH